MVAEAGRLRLLKLLGPFDKADDLGDEPRQDLLEVVA
jgi:hypothetical protein